MSSSYFSEISVQLAKIVSPLIISCGLLGNTLNIFVLTRVNLRAHACSRYFLALASNNLLYSLFQVTFLLANAYSRDIQLLSLTFCKIFQYLASVLSFLSPYFIVLASLDRFCSSSSRARVRRFSDLRIAHRSIVVVLLVTLLFFIPTFLLYDLRDDDGLGCQIRGDTILSQVFIISQVLLYAAVPPLLMIIFGLFTIWNTKQLRILPQTTQQFRRTEGQLARMLLIQVFSYLLLNVPLCIMYLMLVLPLGYMPTDEFFFAYTVLAYPFNFSYATTFFLYILTARVYREELIKLFKRIFAVCRPTRRVHPIGLTQTHQSFPMTHQRLPST